jgi:ectoine hydroxylase-related dioxygenase (phytanoyl-CoA dioxygenase family)
MLTTKQKQEFDKLGFIVIPAFFSAGDIAGIAAWISELDHKQPAPGKEAMYYEQSSISGDNILVRIENFLGDHNPEMTTRILSDKTRDCLEYLLGEEAVLFKDKINYKLPGCRPDKLHQDQAAGWNAFSDWFISMVIVVDENRKDNAALTFMSSGNYARQLMTEEWQPLTHDDPPYQPEEEYTLLEAKPGTVIFFDCYVPHGSPANFSDKSRRNIYLTFNRASEGDMRARYYADKWKNYPPNDAAHARNSDTFRV